MNTLIQTLGSIILTLAIIGSVQATQVTAPLTKLTSKIVAIDADTAAGTDILLCSDSDEAMSACRSFIKGFLQGALLTDTAIIQSLETNEPTFAERAMRTRLGNRSDSPTALAGFCLPADRSILDLAEETLDHVKDSERNSAELAKNVYQSLKIDYPCR